MDKTIVQKINDLECALTSLKEQLKMEIDPEVSDTIIVSNDIPVNTIVYSKWDGKRADRYFFKYISNGTCFVSTSPLTAANKSLAEAAAEIDITMDLQFRLFLNAPADYIWGAIDESGCGYVYIEEPTPLQSEWSGALIRNNRALFIGKFPHYGKVWDKTLIRRKS